MEKYIRVTIVIIVNMVKQKKIKNITTIQISKELRDELAKRGSKDDTFETIIRKLLKNG